MKFKNILLFFITSLLVATLSVTSFAVAMSDSYVEETAKLFSENVIENYSPEHTISFGDAVFILSKAHSFVNSNVLPQDVDFNSALDYAETKGIVSGFDSIDYDSKIRRHQLANLLLDTFGEVYFDKVNSIEEIPDVSPLENYYSDVLCLYNAGVFTGRDEYGNFFANDFVTQKELTTILERCAVEENRRSFVPKDYGNRNPAVSLIEDEIMNRGVRKVQYVASGWNFENPMVYSKTTTDYSFNSFSDISTTQSARIKKEVTTVTSGNVVFECEYTITSNGELIRFEDLDGNLLFELTGEETTYFVNGKKRQDTEIDVTMGSVKVRIFMDMDSRSANLYINGNEAGTFEMSSTASDLSRVIIGTTDKGTLSITVNSVFMYQNFNVNDDFRMENLGVVPLFWDFSDSAKIINMNCDYDIKTAQISDVGYAERSFDSVTDNFVIESYVRITDKQNALFTVFNGNDTAIEISAHDGVFTAEDVFLRNYTPGVWQQIRIEVDTVNDTALVKINGKECETVPFDCDCVNKVRLTTTGSGEFNFDDVKVFNVYEYADYCPEPVPVNDDEWYSGMSICSLWREGSHYGWDCISPYEDLTPVLGYYDEGIPEAMDWEIKFMAEHGYDYQRFCWYYGGFSENIKKPRLCDDAIHDGYFNAKYSDMLDFSLMWENAGSKGTKEEFYNNIWPYWVDWYLTDERYFCIDNKPVITIYSHSSFRDIMGGVEGAKECLDFMRNECIKLGYDGMIVYVSSGTVNDSNSDEFLAVGYDSAAAYHFDEPACDIEYQKLRMNSILEYDTLHFTASCGIGFNDIGWTETRSPLASPEDFEKLLIWARDEYLPAWQAKGRSGWQVKSIMTNTWNEFGEGHYVFPTSLHGFGYMDAHRHVFSSVAGKEDAEHYDDVPTLNQKERLGYLYSGRCIPLRKTQYDNGLAPDSELYEPVVSWDFENVNASYLWGPLSATTKPVYDSNTKSLFGTTTSTDGHIRTLDFVENHFSADTVKYLHVNMMTKADGASRAELYFITENDKSYVAERGTSFNIIGDGKFHDYYVDLTSIPSWKGNIKSLRYDPINVPGDYYIKKIELLEYNVYDRLDINIDSVAISVPPNYFEIDGDTVYTAGNPTSGFYSAHQIYYEWNRYSGKLFLKANNGTKFEFVVGSDIAKVNDAKYQLDRKVSLLDGLVVVPLTFVYDMAGYEYSIGDGNVINVKMLDKNISEILASRKEFEYEFKIPGDNENWYINSASGGVDDDYYVIVAKHNGVRYDPQISLTTVMDSRYSHIAKVRIKADITDNSTSDTSVSFFFTTSSDGNANEAKCVKRYLSQNTPDDEGFYTLTFDFSENVHWKDNITKFRLDPPNRGGTYYIDYIRFEPDQSYIDKIEQDKLDNAVAKIIAENARLGKAFYIHNADAELDIDASGYGNSLCNVKIVDDDLRTGNKAFLVSTDKTNTLVWSYIIIPTRFTPGTTYKVEFDLRLVGDIYGNPASNVSFSPNFRYSQIMEDGTMKDVVDHSTSVVNGKNISTSDGWVRYTALHTVAENSPTRTNDKFCLYMTPIEADGVYYNYQYMIDNINVSVANHYTEFNKNGNFENWKVFNCTGTVSDGNLTITSTKKADGKFDPNTSMYNLNIDSERFTKVRVRVKPTVSPEITDDVYSIYFATETEKELSESKTVKLSLKNLTPDTDGYYTLEFNMLLNKLWDGNVTILRFDPPNCEGTFAVDYIYVDVE